MSRRDCGRAPATARSTPADGWAHERRPSRCGSPPTTASRCTSSRRARRRSSLEPSGHRAGRTPLTVVFMHGFASTMHCWHYQRRALTTAGFRVVIWDQRGHGRSGRGARELHHRPARRATCAPSSTPAAPSGPVVLVGHSMGGMTMMALAEQHPELFATGCVGGRARRHQLRRRRDAAGLGATVRQGASGSFGPPACWPAVAARRADRRAAQMGRDVQDAVVQRWAVRLAGARAGAVAPPT